MPRSMILHGFGSALGLLLMSILLVALAQVVLPPLIHAQTFVVDTTADNPALTNCMALVPADCSLRGAISRANGTAGADTITFAAGTNAVPIVLAGPAGEDANAGGDLDISSAGGDLLIQGNGKGNTIVDGGGIDRVFHVCPNGCTNVVSLTGVTIRKGYTLGKGGGILNNGANLLVQSSTIGGAGFGNTALSGGGIANEAGTTTVDGSTVSANLSGFQGGGIYNAGDLLVWHGSTIGGAGGTNDAGSVGGGIYNLEGTTTVDDSTIAYNTAVKGGGIFNTGTLIIQNGSTVGGDGAGNQAGETGGGMYNSGGGTATVIGSSISGNVAVDGAGIYNVATLTIQSDSTIGGDNEATDYGGGLFNSGTGTATVDGASVSANTSDYGGGIRNEGTLIIQNGSTIGGAGAGNEATYGGGISTWGGTTTLDGSTVSANVATEGGGGIDHAQGTLIIRNGSTIGGAGAGNEAPYGAGISTFQGTTTLDDSTVSANVATVDGGGIDNFLGTLIVRNGSTIGGAGAGNEAAGYAGGIHNSGDMTVQGSTISNNTAGDRGGGIYNWNGTATVTGSRILNNQAAAGGGVYNSENVAGATAVTASCIVGNSDASFINDVPAQQIATGNWWGAATGPNTPGADTTDGSVDTSGFLTAPILGCAPDLRIQKANDTGGIGTPNMPFAWALTVTNTGDLTATFGAGMRILIDELPPGPAYGPPRPGSFVGLTGNDHLLCGLTANTLTCQAAGGGVDLSAGGSLVVTLPVTPTTGGLLRNPSGSCSVDPDGHLAEGDETNNSCPEDIVVVTADTHSSFLPLVFK